ncbi:PTS lactose transporter subunit IIC [Aliishimia ponticola]|uniref:PTS lactose transporter subunit IIC n=1 Tax=Aliishimia ponticola TaxID=2499833 RepID=A0A4V3XJX0_9RHOB|nr:PTS sugar transporter subunit IIA [Aliishimia ponticola]THH34703.1 PTS lactose transporter subunit IIC [Aliishimia ponticola]
MDFAKLLKPEAVKVSASVSSKKRLFQDIGDLAGQAYDLDANAVTDALRAREALGPTGVGHGVALPHARLHGLSEVRGAFILLEKPIAFDAVDQEPVDISFALLAPEDAGVEHLKALALVSRTLREPSICAKLRANHDPATLFTILSEAHSVKAA